jgi:poly(hydroxyalkanoate) depolymerase family esterase
MHPRLGAGLIALILVCEFGTVVLRPSPAAGSGQWTCGWHATDTTGLVSSLAFDPFPPPFFRGYCLYIPSTYSATGSAVPLIVMLHGCLEDPESFAGGTRMNELAESEHFLVLYPREDASSNIAYCWNWFDSANQHRKAEAAVIADMVLMVEEKYNVDKHRVYVAGMSAGGAMASNMASCYAGTFAAAAVHSGFEYEAATSLAEAMIMLSSESGDDTHAFSFFGVHGDQSGTAGSEASDIDPNTAGHDAYECSGKKQLLMPVIVIHGSNDRLVRAIHANRTIRTFLKMNDWGDDGVDNASVPSNPTAVERKNVPDGRSYTVTQYSYSGQVLLEQIKVDDMHNLNTASLDEGHAWSGGDSHFPFNDPKGPDASRIIWEFFKLHSR